MHGFYFLNQIYTDIGFQAVFHRRGDLIPVTYVGSFCHLEVDGGVASELVAPFLDEVVQSETARSRTLRELPLPVHGGLRKLLH